MFYAEIGIITKYSSLTSPMKMRYNLNELQTNFSRQQFEIFFYFFLENRIWHFTQIISCQILFSRKKKKNIVNLPSTEFPHSTVSVKDGPQKCCRSN